MISFVYYGTGQKGEILKTSSEELVPFTDENIEQMKLNKVKSAGLKKAIQAARDSLWILCLSFVALKMSILLQPLW